jgi:myeloid differentiation primary response protein MyD88
MDYESVVKQHLELLTNKTISCLSASTINALNGLLKGLHVLTEEEAGVSRDARGLFEFFNRDSVDQEITSLLHQEKLSSLMTLVQGIEFIGRFDVLDDIIDSIVKDALNAHKKRSPTSVTQEDSFYDAYVCYADEDLDFVVDLTRLLEEDFGFKLFLRERDSEAGSLEYDSFTRVLNSCRRMIIIVSPDFLVSKECEFQTRFATSLGYTLSSRLVVPVVVKKCPLLPPSLQILSKIDCTSVNSLDKTWTRDKLVRSLQSKKNHSCESNSMKMIPSVNEGPSSSSSSIKVEEQQQPKTQEEEEEEQSIIVNSYSNKNNKKSSVTSSSSSWVKNLSKNLFSSTTTSSTESNSKQKSRFAFSNNDKQRTCTFLLKDQENLE